MNNYKTKFKIGDQVKIVAGFYQGYHGKVMEYMPAVTNGLVVDNINRKIVDDSGLYTVRVSFFKSLYVHETDLELKVLNDN